MKKAGASHLGAITPAMLSYESISRSRHFCRLRENYCNPSVISDDPLAVILAAHISLVRELVAVWQIAQNRDRHLRLRHLREPRFYRAEYERETRDVLVAPQSERGVTAIYDVVLHGAEVIRDDTGVTVI